MTVPAALAVFDALASPVRLEIYRLLVRHEPTGLVAGEIAEALAMPSTNLSFHLKALVQAGLVQATHEGRFIRHRADLARMHAVVAFLAAECCGGDAERCGVPVMAATAARFG